MSRERPERSGSRTRGPLLRSARWRAWRSEWLFRAVLAFMWLAMVLGARRAAASFPCAGDCHDDGQVTIDELITGVDVALGTTAR